MPPKFGNYLFSNLKGQAPELSRSRSGDLPHAFGELKEQMIILRREDFRADDPGAPELDWSKVDQGKIAIKLKDTQGMLDGRVTVKASTLQRIHPALFAGSTRFRLSVCGFLENGRAPSRRQPEAECGRGRKADWSGF
jgi:hypothetical protein